MTKLNEILSAAQSLPASERAQLIAALWDSSSPNDWIGPSGAWLAESQRRSNEYDAGKMTGASWDVVREKARRKAALDD